MIYTSLVKKIENAHFIRLQTCCGLLMQIGKVNYHKEI
jgi:hypothetical protein